MAIYIYRNGEQFGPYEEAGVIEQLHSGQLSPEDLGILQGEKDWKKLRDMFPDAAAVTPSVAAIPPPPVPVATASAAPVQYEAVYRGTTLQKIFFGLCLLVAVIGLGAFAFYFYTMMGPSGDLQADLTRASYRILARNLSAGFLVGGFFALLAFIIAFKRKLIRSNGTRIALRVIFVMILLVGLGNLAYGVGSYLTYRAPYTSSAKKEPNELLKALDLGVSAVAPYEMAAFFVPVGAGLFLFGLSGTLMTKKLRTE